ncbi:hypothetical protein A7U60_g7242 [Sanghuangporus baumii]|uniref:Uncharacterized protein n=1 Tax=Sanghuangporus baumii TaxID=108892 RepID=A0A9Q5N672_SANBA|nr:hypothetical protein A7U60_g7242 [Sanghuangporus baumii]
MRTSPYAHTGEPLRNMFGSGLRLQSIGAYPRQGEERKPEACVLLSAWDSPASRRPIRRVQSSEDADGVNGNHEEAVPLHIWTHVPQALVCMYATRRKMGVRQHGRREARKYSPTLFEAI